MTEIGHEPIDYRSMVHAVAVAVTFSRKNHSNPGSRAVTPGDHITNLRSWMQELSTALIEP